MHDVQALVRVAQALADETRLRLLAVLMEGEATVSDLVARLGVAQPRISTHLAVLRHAGLVTAQTTGRQRAYRVDADRVKVVLAAMDALSSGAAMRPPRSAQAARQVRDNTAIRQARTCYDHLAGVAGVELLDELLRRGWVEAGTGGRPAYTLTPRGAQALTARGVDLTRVGSTRRALAVGCLDWTERRPHLAGALGAELLRVLERAGAVAREAQSRAVRPATPIGDWLDGPASV